MSITADVVLTLGTLHLDVHLEVAGAAVAVVGPNGAGKTTLLRALAGLIPPRLLAHLNALDNVAFGLRARHVPRSEARRRAAHWLDRVGLGNITGHRPRQMSGGQAQRVALARTLATEPAVLLLDEPLSAVDASARVQLRRVLRDELRRHPGARVIVTHDPIEAAALPDQLLVLEGGQVTQRGPLIEVAARPRSAWMAMMVGLNLLGGMADGGAIALPGGETLMTPYSATGPVFAAFRPGAVSLYRLRPDDGLPNTWPGRATELHPAGDRARVHIEGPVPLIAEVTTTTVAQLNLADGGPVWATLQPTNIDVYPV